MSKAATSGTGALFQKYYGQLMFALVAAAGLLILFRVILPAGNGAYGGLMQEVENRRLLAEAKSGLHSADSLREIQEYALKQIGLMKSVPQESRASHILEALLRGLKEEKLVISDINSLEPVNHGGHIEYPYEIGLSGSFHGLQKYLIDLETSDMSVKIRTLTAASRGIHQSEISAQVGVSVYVLKQ